MYKEMYKKINREMKKLKTLFLGTPAFAIPSLELLYFHPRIELSLVISMPDRPAGRGQNLQSPKVIEYAKTNKIPFFQTEKLSKELDLFNKLIQDPPDLIIVLAFAQFLNEKWLNLPKLGCYNIHTSLLPRHRGAAPIQYALLNNDDFTGVTIQKMVKTMDAGDVVAKSLLPIRKWDRYDSLSTRLQFAAASTLEEFIFRLINQDLEIEKQDEQFVTFAPTLKKEDGHLKFEEVSAEEILNKFRGLTPWPGIYFYLDGQRIKILHLQISIDYNNKPNSIEIKNKKILVGCKTGTLEILSLASEGKGATSAESFIQGYRGKWNLTLQ